MVDLHSHVLPGLDDGTKTLAEAVALGAAALADGVRVLAATPHVRDDFPTSPQAMEHGVAHVVRALADAGVPLDVRPGGEIALDALERLDREELRRFGLGGNPDYVLLEFPSYGWPLAIAGQLSSLVVDGFVPVLAHPERNLEVQRCPERLAPLVETGALVQLTAASLDGRLGRRARAACDRLLDRGLAHLIASDVHAPGDRRAGLASAAQALGDADLAEWLLHGVPQAIVDGAPIPRRPSRGPSRPWRRVRRVVIAR